MPGTNKGNFIRIKQSVEVRPGDVENLRRLLSWSCLAGSALTKDIPLEIYAVLREVFLHLKDGQAISLIPDAPQAAPV